MKKPQAMLIDLDDTIIDYRSGVHPCWRVVCDNAGTQVRGLDADDLFLAVCRVRDWYWSDPVRHRTGRADMRAARTDVARRALLSLGFDLPNLARELGWAYQDLRDERAQLIPGAVEALQRFKRHGIGLALITNGAGDAQRGKVERFDLERLFDHIFIEGEIGFGKPEPEVYLQAMAALQSDPSATWCVGDNLEWEVAAPQKLGIYSVWLDPTGDGLPANSDVVPDRAVASIAEISF